MTYFGIIAGAVIWLLAIFGFILLLLWIFRDQEYEDLIYRNHIVEEALQELLKDQLNYPIYDYTKHRDANGRFKKVQITEKVLDQREKQVFVSSSY